MVENTISGSTWGERLAMNLISYSLVLGPIAFIVLTTKYKLCPTFLQSSTLVQWFVYGSSNQSSLNGHNHNKNGDDKRLLLEEKEDRRKNHRHGGSSDTLAFITCFFGLMVSYLLWGIFQEKIMTTEYQVSLAVSDKTNATTTAQSSTITFHDSQFLVFLNRILAFILSICVLVQNRRKKSQSYATDGKYIRYPHHVPSKPQPPLYEYVYCSLSNILSSWCQYEALKYVNFPTQVLSKSCKIVPVMLMSKLMFRTKYHYLDYACAILLSMGMFIFIVNQPPSGGLISNKDHHHNTSDHQELADNLGKHLKQASPMISGLFILALYLAFDSFTSNWQQSLFGRYGVSNWQMMAATNFYSIILTLTSLYQLGHLGPAFKLLAQSASLTWDCIMMSVFSSAGQLFVYLTIKRFGSVAFAAIMTMRQFLAILLSCIIYQHHITMSSSLGLVLVFLVVAYQMWRKSREAKRRRMDSARAQAEQSGPTNGRIQFRQSEK